MACAEQLPLLGEIAKLSDDHAEFMQAASEVALVVRHVGRLADQSLADRDHLPHDLLGFSQSADAP